MTQFAALARAALAAKAKRDDTPELLLADLASEGFEVEVAADALWVRPVSRLTDDLKARIRKHKPAILALLTPKLPEGWDAAKAQEALADALASVDALEKLAPEDHGWVLFDCERTVLKKYASRGDPLLFEWREVHQAIRRNLLEMRAK